MLRSGILFLLLVCSWTAFAEGGKPDGEALYTERCAMCHALGFLAPTVEQIRRLSVEQVEAAMWHGAMQEHANGLSRPERLAIARWLGNDSDVVRTPDPGVAVCKRTTAAGVQSAPWPGWSPDNRFDRHVADPTITPARVRGTQLQWAHPFPSHAAFSSSGNPVAVREGVVYTGNLNHFVYALDEASGCARWTFFAEGRVRSNVALAGDRLVFGDLMANVYALDAASGELRWRARADWTPGARITGNVTVHDGVAYVPVSSLEEVAAMKMDLPCCTFRGAVVAFDLRNGEVRWKTHTIDRYAEYLGTNAMGIDRFGPSGVPVWSGITVDAKRGLLYVGNGNQFTEPAVIESDAVMALDMQTGAKRWIKSLAPEQMGGQDIYHLACEAWWDPERKNCSPDNPAGHGDRDIGAPPALVTRTDGRDVIIAGSKDGMLYALDPDADGAIMWNLRVGRGGEMGGIEYGVATDGRYVYAPVVDMDADLSSDGSLTAVDLITGKAVWRVENIEAACAGKPTPPCGSAMLTPPTVAGGVVFAGLVDGTLRAYDAANGNEVWRFDTARDFTGVNGLKGNGGSLGNGGPVIVGNRIYVTSGFNILNTGIAGNVLLAFEIPR